MGLPKNLEHLIEKAIQKIKGWSNYASYEKNKKDTDIMEDRTLDTWAPVWKGQNPRNARRNSEETQEQGIRSESIIGVDNTDSWACNPSHLSSRHLLQDPQSSQFHRHNPFKLLISQFGTL